MFWVLGLVLLLAVALGYRLLQIRRVLGELAKALEEHRPYLFRIEGSWAKFYRLDRLSHLFNRLSLERERSSRQEQNYLRRLDVTLSNLVEAVVVVDESGRLYLANPTARELFGISGPVQGQRIEGLVQSGRFLEFMRKVNLGDSPGLGEIELISGQQSHFFEVTGARIPDVGGDPQELTLFVLHDVTNLKRLENLRKEFVANVSHELRTPVTIIKGYAETLAEDYHQLDDVERQRFLNKINKHASRLHLLLEDLLILSRLERGAEHLNRVTCSLSHLIQDVLEGFLPALKERKIRVRVNVSTDLEKAFLDPVKTSQIFQNLLDNAVRYAKGATRIRMDARRSGSHLVLSVEDNGCGIPEADLAHIFERFYRVDKGRSRESGGTGLGLSIVKHVAQLHGGEARASSRVGEGTRIEIILPWIDPEPENLPSDHLNHRPPVPVTTPLTQ